MIFCLFHEGTHALIATAFGEYQAFHVRPYGLEVEFKTPVAEREGIKWGFISGTSNAFTIILGYIMFLARKKVTNLRSPFLRKLSYWLIFFLLLIDPLNLSVGPFIYGGDVGGVVAGFGINRYAVQGIFLMIFLFNRELIVQKLFPVYGIKTKHPLFQPWLERK
ncbi:MAG: hypothetical protein H5U03_05205 [Clostridia bacterium]|nr:hypothetical protein [Clostridia bacterium]